MNTRGKRCYRAVYTLDSRKRKVIGLDAKHHRVAMGEATNKKPSRATRIVLQEDYTGEGKFKAFAYREIEKPFRKNSRWHLV